MAEKKTTKSTKKPSPRTWNADIALTEKDNQAPLELFPSQKDFETQFRMSRTVQDYHNLLVHHFETLGIDTKRNALTIVHLAKSYATEQMCEEEIAKGGMFYSTTHGGVEMHREHPASKTLHSTRVLILTTLKSLGIMADGKGGLTVSQGTEAVGFEKLRNL